MKTDSMNKGFGIIFPMPFLHISSPTPPPPPKQNTNLLEIQIMAVYVQNAADLLTTKPFPSLDIILSTNSTAPNF